MNILKEYRGEILIRQKKKHCQFTQYRRTILWKMAQSKLSGFAAKLAKGGPPSAGLGLLGALGALAYGVTQSVYTGIYFYRIRRCSFCTPNSNQ